MPLTHALRERFRHHYEQLGATPADARLLVAVSGGLDSVVLLHLLRSLPGREADWLVVGHCDHALRARSAADARWLRGLCRAWRVPFLQRRADEPPRGEGAARAWRYAALHEMAREAGAAYIATAHHADDQAETVMLRVLRGTGIDGLRGIAAVRADGILRPLLPFRRQPLRRYAREVGLRWREDASNRLRSPARNRIRLEILPRVEATFAPGARRALVRLAQLAASEAAAWVQLTERAAAEIAREQRDAVLLDRRVWARQAPLLRARVLRQVLAPFEVVLDARGTRTAVQFITDAPSGRELHLPRGLRMYAEFDVVRLARAHDAPPDGAIRIAAAAGADECWLGGARLRVAWRTRQARDDAPGGGMEFGLSRVMLPIEVRRWRTGDRICTAGGTKSLKKLFNERRVPRGARQQVAVLQDARGRVISVAGLAQDPATRPLPGDAILFIQIS